MSPPATELPFTSLVLHGLHTRHTLCHACTPGLRPTVSASTKTRRERADPMGVELAAAAAIPPEQRYRKGLTYPNPLAGNPGKPKFAATVKRADGGTETVACPVATRTMVALMDMNAVIGGAACHWGGPAAL